MVGIGSIISVGGGGGGGGGGGSGISSLNSQIGPAVTIVGVNGVAVSAAGNVITVDSAALSGLIGTTGTGTGSGCFVEAFTATTSGRFTHNLGTRNLLVQVLDDSGPPQAILPDAVIYDTLNVFSVIFNSPQAGTVLAVNCNETLGGGTTSVSPRVELDLEFKSAFNSNTYSEITRVSGQITQIDIWETNAKLNKLFTKAITRVSGEIVQVSVTCDQTLATLVTDLARVSGEISTITKTYTPAP